MEQGVGVAEFHPAINEARIIGGSPTARRVISTIFKACGWKFRTRKPRRNPAPRKTVIHSHFEKLRRKKK